MPIVVPEYITREEFELLRAQIDAALARKGAGPLHIAAPEAIEKAHKDYQQHIRSKG